MLAECPVNVMQIEVHMQDYLEVLLHILLEIKMETRLGLQPLFVGFVYGLLGGRSDILLVEALLTCAPNCRAEASCTYHE